MATVATLFSGTIRPVGVPISRFPSSVRSLRLPGAPQTTTSKIFDCSYRLPTIRPDVSVVASRRTSPGRSPYFCAAASLTRTSTVGWRGVSRTVGAASPGTWASIARTCPAFCCSTPRSGP